MINLRQECEYYDEGLEAIKAIVAQKGQVQEEAALSSGHLTSNLSSKELSDAAIASKPDFFCTAPEKMNPAGSHKGTCCQ